MIFKMPITPNTILLTYCRFYMIDVNNEIVKYFWIWVFLLMFGIKITCLYLEIRG